MGWRLPVPDHPGATTPSRRPHHTHERHPAQCLHHRHKPALQHCVARSSASAPHVKPDAQHEGEQAPWTAEDLERMRLQGDLDEESMLGEEWRSRFAGELEELFTYADQDEERWRMAHEASDADPRLASNAMTPALVNELIGLGTWRLKGSLDPGIAFLVQRIEATWREAFMDDLSLYPLEAWKARYSICDSLDPKNELQGWSYSDVPDPPPGQEGYPRLLMENRIYCSRVFRKLHIEVAVRQDGLQVLHVVMYPRYSYDLPILGIDMVLGPNGAVTLAIVDACPVRANKYLPPHYLQTMTELQQVFLPELLSNNMKERAIPSWGEEIFSPACVCIKPESPADLAGFLKYTVALTRAHCALAKLVTPLQGNGPQQQARQQELLKGHKRFVDNQLANKKTTRVLEVAFGAEWTAAYMHNIVFDFFPESEPPVEDTSLAELYRYFEREPVVGDSAAVLAGLESQVSIERSEEVLSALAAGEPVRQDRVEAALQVLYDLDPEFQDNCNVLFRSMEGGTASAADVGPFLAQCLPALGFPTPLPRWTSTGHGPRLPENKDEDEET